MVKDEISLVLNRRQKIRAAGADPTALSLRLEAGAFVRLGLESPGPEGKVELRVLSPAGRLLTRSRWRAVPGRPKEVLVYAEEGGDFRLELRALGSDGVRRPFTAVARAEDPRGSSSNRHRTAASWAYEAAEIALEEGDLAVASGGFDVAREHFTAARDSVGQAKVWMRMGDVFLRQANPQGALDAWTSSLELLQETPHLSLRGRLLENAGRAQLALRKPRQALLSFRSALTAYQRAGDLAGQVSALHRSGEASRALGHLRQALRDHEGCLELLARLDCPREEILVLAGMGNLYLAMGHPAEARAMLLHGKLTAERLGYRYGEALCLRALGDTLRELGDLAQARACLERACEAFGEEGRSVWKAAALTSLGAVHLEGESFAEGARVLERAVRLLRSPADSTQRATAQVYLARCHYERGRLEEAGALFKSSLPLFRRAENPPGQVAALHGEALAAFHLGHLRRATERSAAAVRSAVEIPPGTSLHGLLSPHQLPPSAPWQLQIECLVSLGEREARAGFHRKALDVCAHWRRHRLRPLMTAVAESSESSGASRRRELNAELSLARAQVRLENPRLALLLTGPRQPWAGSLPPLPPATQLVAFFLGEARSYAWLCSSRRVRTFRLPPRAEIDAAAQGFFDLVETSHRADDDARRRAGEHLSQLLLSKLGEFLNGERLFLVPDGSLTFLPFAALPSPSGRYLVEDFEITLLPDPGPGERPAPASGSLAADGPADPCLGILGSWQDPAPHGFSPLVAQARAVAEGFREVRRRDLSLLSAESREPGAPDLREYSFLHLATRFSSHPSRPEILLTTGEGGEGLAGGASVPLGRVYELVLRAELVTLDLRPDPLGDAQQELALSALLQGFFHAGARRVLVHLWDTDGKGRAEGLRRFFETLLGDPKSPPVRFSRALRQAQLSMIRDPRWSNPRHWGGLQLVGDGIHQATGPGDDDGLEDAGQQRIRLDPTDVL